MLIKRLFRYWICRIFSPDALLKDRYAAFRTLLQSDKEAHELMAGLQKLAYDKKYLDQIAFYALYDRLETATDKMVKCLIKIAPSSYLTLPRRLKKIAFHLRNQLTGQPHHPQRLHKLMVHIDHLNLLDPAHPSFRAQACQSIHDIIRFAHERAVSEMFLTGVNVCGKIKGAKNLISDKPFKLYILDVDGGLCKGAEKLDDIDMSMVCSIPMSIFWKGIINPDVKWSGPSHFDWKSFGEAVSAGGIADMDSPAFASYAIISADYMNINIKFGYHFVIVDTICGKDAGNNHIMLSFTGGGGDLRGKLLRAAFLAGVLTKLEFNVETMGDSINARIDGLEQTATEERLDIIGRLLGVTRLMDMNITDESMAEKWIADFMAGRSDFT